MLRRLTASLLIALVALPVAARQPSPPAVTANPAIVITVDAAAGRHAIDPRIYGSSFASAAAMADLGITINRWGGNAMSRYNWAISTANRCKDYFFENQPDPVSSGDGSNGKSADDFIGPVLAAGAQPILTIPMMSRLPKDRVIRCGFAVAKYGAQDEVDPQHGCGNGLLNGARMRFVNDPDDTSAVFTSAHQGNWIQHLIDTWGSAANGGVRYYALDNEPGLWSFDHWDVHPDGATYDEVWGKMAEYGAMIKAKDPNALITGVEEWGWSGYFQSGKDMENGDGADAAAHGGEAYIDWILDQAHAYEVAHGQRILDFLTVHFYPQSGEFSDDTTAATQDLRNRSTRSLWDPSYVDESWIGGTGIDGGHVRLIPRLKEWVQNHYPGTKIGITEYNWGADFHINGGTAQADILGILGREGVDLAVRWDTPPDGSYTYNAFKMYRNHDGTHLSFGDTSVSAAAPNPDSVSAFAAVRSSDKALTIMLVSKGRTGDTPVTINLANFVAARSAAASRWQLDGANAITHPADVALAGSSLSLTLPQQSVTLLVIPGATAPGAPTIGSATPGNGTATISFTAPASDGGATITSYTATCNAGGFTASGPASPITVGGLTNGTTYSCSVTATNAAGTSAPSAAVSVTPAATFGAPASFVAAATSTSAVHLSWSAVGGAVSYEIQRSVNHSAFSTLTTTGGTAYDDTALAPSTTYLYQVRANGASGPSPFTPVDAATTILFTDDPLSAGATRVKAAHITELRTAVNAMRAAGGLAARSFTDASPAGVRIKALHVSELRTALDEARAAIGLAALAYTDPTLTTGSTKVKGVHLTELRNGVK